MSQIGRPAPTTSSTRSTSRSWSTSTRPTTAPQELRDALQRGVSDYAAWYRDYYERNLTDESRPFPIDPAGRGWCWFPGVGIVTSGVDAGRARTSRDLYHRAIAVQDAADALGGIRLAQRNRGFRDRVLAAGAVQARPGAGARGARCRIALIAAAPAASVAPPHARLASEGAHVAVADLNAEGSRLVADEIVSAYGEGRAAAIQVDVTDEVAVTGMMRQTSSPTAGSTSSSPPRAWPPARR